MRNSLDYRLPDGRTVADAVFAPLDQDQTPAVVDVGARNGFVILPASYTQRSTLIGFEPNPEEYRKLVTNSTDAARVGIETPPFKDVKYFDCALWDREEVRPFYVTVGAGASTMMGEVDPRVGTRLYQNYPKASAKAGKSFSELHGKVVEVVDMQCRRLDALVDTSQTIDFLKLDVEGAELRVLKGAEALLAAKKVLFVYTEFVMLPFYAEHPVFGDQQVLLRDHGMRLIDLELNHVGYTRSPTLLGDWSDRRLLHAGDACFVLDPDRNNLTAQERQRLAAISLALGFNSFAISLLREAGLTRGGDVDAIERALTAVPLPRYLRRTWAQIPYTVAGQLSRLRRLFGR